MLDTCLIHCPSYTTCIERKRILIPSHCRDWWPLSSIRERWIARLGLLVFASDACWHAACQCGLLNKWLAFHVGGGILAFGMDDFIVFLP
jgi:hypothetical protein